MNNKRSIGIDIGSASVKISVFEGDGKRAHFVECREFDLTEEGILNEGELYRGLHDWLAGQKLLGARTCVGIPQYLATTSLADFPPAKPSQLGSLVEQEARQMGDFTDEHFLHGYVPVKAGFGRNNPVLIGLCREEVVRERMRALDTADIPCDDVSMSGLAVVNTLLKLHPECMDDKKPILILDLGKMNSTAVVLAGGQPLFIGSMSFGGESFERAVRERVTTHKSLAGTGEAGIDTMLAEMDLTQESPHSDLWRVVKSLDSEIQNIVEHWRSQEREELSEVPIGRVFLCGGACRVGGLRKWLEDAFEIHMELLGPEIGGEIRPEFAVAYGIGLESAAACALPLSLLPPEVVAVNHRLRRFPIAVCASVVLLLSILGFELAVWRRCTRMMEEMSHYEEQLGQCDALIRKIDETVGTSVQLEQRMMPLAESVNRSGRLLKALGTISRSCTEDTWFYYLADAASYYGWGEHEANADDLQEGPRRGRKIQKDQKKVAVGIFETGMGKDGTAALAEFPVIVQAKDVRNEAAMVAAGFTTMADKAGYSDAHKRVGELAARLSDKTVFGRVDTMEDVSEGARVDVARPWTDFLMKTKSLHAMPFTLRMPYFEPEITQE